MSMIAIPRDGADGAADPVEERPRAELALRAVRAAIEKSLSGATAAEAAILAPIWRNRQRLPLATKSRRGSSKAVHFQRHREAGESFAAVLRKSENEYIRERAADVEEICLLLLEQIQGTKLTPAPELAEASVVIAESLAPQRVSRSQPDISQRRSAGDREHDVAPVDSRRARWASRWSRASRMPAR